VNSRLYFQSSKPLKMKFLKFFILFILVLTILFILVGVLNPTINYGHEITVDKPIEEVWAIHQDETKYDQWLVGFKSIDLISGEASKVGSKYKIIVNPGDGQPDFEMIETIKSIKPNDHITLNFDSDMMFFDQTTSFKELNGKTTLKTDSEVKAKGLMMRSLFGLMDMIGGSFQKQEVENIENLKKVIDNNTTDYGLDS